MERKKEWGKKTQFHSIYEWWDLRGGGTGKFQKFLTLYMRIRHLVWLRISPPPSGKKSPDPELLIRFIQ